MNISCPIQSESIKDPDSIALIDDQRKYTYLDLENLVQKLHYYLKNNNQDKKVISTVQITPFNFFALIFAALRAKKILFPLSEKLPIESRNYYTLKYNTHLITDALISSLKSKKASPLTTYSPDQPITWVLTSGSTNRAKICQHNLGNHLINAKDSNNRLKFFKNDRWLLSLPFYHVSGLSLFFRASLAKAALISSLKSIEQVLIEKRITHISVVNIQLKKILEIDPFPISIKCILAGGGPVSKSLISECIKRTIPIYLTYGLTEMASQVLTSTKENPFSLKKLPFSEIKLSSKNELLVKGKKLFSGYVEDDKIHLPIDSSGYFSTKDIFSQEEQGLFNIIGRKDSMFISGGENIYPEEIEETLLNHNSVKHAIVIAIDDAKFGQRPVAFIKSDHKISELKLMEYLQRFLPKYKIPDFFYSYPEDGFQGIKPNRNKLKELLINNSVDNPNHKSPS